jgi:hypothetical protein
VIDQCPALDAKWTANVSCLRRRGYGADNTLSGSQIASDLIQLIRHQRREGVPLDFVAFLGVESLSANLPAVYAESSFWPTILAVTASEQITTAFVLNGSAEEFSPAQEMDYILRFSKEAGNHRSTISIDRSATPPASERYPDLVLDLEAGTLQRAPSSE